MERHHETQGSFSIQILHQGNLPLSQHPGHLAMSGDIFGCHGWGRGRLEVLPTSRSFPGVSDSKGSAYNAGNLGLIPGSGRSSPGEGNGNPLQYSCLENPMDRGARQATVHGVAKSRTQLSNFTSLTQIPFPFRSSQSIQQRFLCYTVGSD